MRSTRSTASFVTAALLLAGAAAAQSRSAGITLAGRAVFPRPTGATPGSGVTRPGGAVLGPGVTRTTGATPGPGVRRAVGAIPGPDVTRPTGATARPGVPRAVGATLGPDTTRVTGATPGPGVRRAVGAIPGPEVTRPTGAEPGPGVNRTVGAIPGPNVGRPTGASPNGRDLVRPTGPTSGFTFRPLFQPLFRPGDRFPLNEALRADGERGDLSTEAPAPARVTRPDLLTDVPPRERARRPELPGERLLPAPLLRLPAESGSPGALLRPDLSTERPAPPRLLRPDLTTDAPPPARRERFDLSTDERTRSLGESLAGVTPTVGSTGVVETAPVPVAGTGLQGIVGGTFTGGVVGTLYSWLLDADKRLGTWRLFDQPEYRAARFAPSGPLVRWSLLGDRGWIVSGRASIGPDWSTLRDRGWTLSGRAGYGPDWSVLRE